jgi:hypothetical protein
LTGFHLKDIFDSTNKMNDIKKQIYDVILFNKRFPKSLEISKAIVKEEETKEEKKNNIVSDFNLEKFVKDNNIPDAIKKLEKADLFDQTLFFKIDIGVLESTLDIKPEGKKHKIMKKIKELREKFEKEGSISYIDFGLIEDGEIPSLKWTRSHTYKQKDKKIDF